MSVAAFDVGIKNFAVCVASCGSVDDNDCIKDSPLPSPFKICALEKFCVGSCSKIDKTKDDDLVVNLFSWLDVNRDMFVGVGVVAIELQKKTAYGKFKPPNISMVILSHALQCWFLSNRPDITVVFQSPSSKNHVVPKTKKRKRCDVNGDGAYDTNKRDAVTTARALVSVSSPYRKMFFEDKSDDYADALLHALYRLQRI